MTRRKEKPKKKNKKKTEPERNRSVENGDSRGGRGENHGQADQNKRREGENGVIMVEEIKRQRERAKADIDRKPQKGLLSMPLCLVYSSLRQINLATQELNH